MNEFLQHPEKAEKRQCHHAHNHMILEIIKCVVKMPKND